MQVNRTSFVGAVLVVAAAAGWLYLRQGDTSRPDPAPSSTARTQAEPGKPPATPEKAVTAEREADEGGSTRIATLTWKGEPTVGVAFVDDGLLMTAHASDVVRVWDLQSGTVARQARLPGEAASLATSADGRKIVIGLAGSAGGVSAVVFDPVRLEPLARLSGHQGTVRSVAVTSDGAMAATASDAGLWLWDVASGRSVERWPAAVRPRALSLASDGVLLAAGVDRPAGLIVWPSSADGAARRAPVMTATGAGAVAAVVLTTDGRLVSAGDDGRLRVWDVGSDEPRATLEGHGAAITAITVNPDSSRIASGSADRTVRVWDEAPSLLHTYQLADAVQCLAFSPDGGRLAAVLRGGTIAVWDMRRLSELLLERGRV
jgi:WD40 repeat protein